MPTLEERTCGARRQGKKKQRRKALATNLFITTVALLSPSPAANANVGHLGKK